MRRAFITFALLALSGGVNNARPLVQAPPLARVVALAATTGLAHIETATPRAGGGSVWITSAHDSPVD